MPVVFLNLIQSTTNHTGMKPMKHAAAIQILIQAAEVCENNAPINDQEGDTNQAALERENAAAFRKAITTLSDHPDGV